MPDLNRFGVSIDENLLVSFDKLIGEQGYGNRSEALRDLIRDALIKSKIEDF
jgi:CopG family nickel-responsive transcriptional regulator